MTMPSNSRPTVFIADNHPVVLTGLRALLEGAQIQVIGEATSATQAIELATELKPDIAIVEVELNGTSILTQFANHAPDIILICLTRHEDTTHVQHALASGSRGYVLKRSEQKCLLDAIGSVYSGDFYIDPAISNRFFPVIGSTIQMDRPNCRGSAQLTERERDVLKYVALGFANKEVAAKLGVTPKSVETYKMRASIKLDIYSRSKIVQYAILQGWFQENIQ